jgi:hypothetical protein
MFLNIAPAASCHLMLMVCFILSLTIGLLWSSARWLHSTNNDHTHTGDSSRVQLGEVRMHHVCSALFDDAVHTPCGALA